MKLVFVNSPISGYNARDLFESEPLGIAYLAAYLEQYDYEVEIFDCFAKGIHQINHIDGLLRKGLTDDQIREGLLAIDPDVIGIHANFTMYFPDAENVARIARQLFPERPIVFGGAHSTMEARSIVEKGIGDYIVRSEGEHTALEFLNALKDGKPLGNILGLTYRDSDGTVHHNPDRPLIQDIDLLPMPAWDKLDMDIYLKTSRESSPFSMNFPAASLITSRGCQYDCVFCSTKNMWRKKWRGDSPERVVGMIEHLATKYGVKEFIIQDDNFLGSRKRVHSILDLLIEKDLGVSLHDPAGLTVWTVDDALLVKMQKAGFYRVLFPVETGNPKTLEFVNKPVDLVKAKEKVKIANELGFWTQANFIIGFPYETREDIMVTFDYAFNSGFDFAAFLIAQPFAGAELYDIFKEDGLLKEETLEKRSIFFKTQFDTHHLKAEEIQELRDWAASQYLKRRVIALLNPVYFFKYFLPKVNSLKKFKYFLRITFGNFNFIFNRYRKADIDTVKSAYEMPPESLYKIKDTEQSSSAAPSPH